MSFEITEEQIELLKHMLGARSDVLKKDWGYRNYYCSTTGRYQDQLAILEEHGYVVSQSKPHHNPGYIYFYATKKGAIAAGMKPYQLRKQGLFKKVKK